MRKLFSNKNKTKEKKDTNAPLLFNERLQLKLEKEEVKLFAMEKEISRLKEHLTDLRNENSFLKDLLKDQRLSIISPLSEKLNEEGLIPRVKIKEPKPATVREIQEAVSKASKTNLKKPIQRNVTNSAFFVKEPEVSTLDTASTEIKTEIDREETPDVTMARLKYKIDRGEYKLAKTVYAQQVWNIILDRKDEVPDNVRNRRYNDVLWGMRTKTNTAFDTKFEIKEVLDISAYTKIHQHLRKDLKNRALVEPLLQFPNDLVKEITEENERLYKENVFELKDVKQQKALDEAKQEDEDLDRLMPDVMDHFNPMAEAEIALLDEEIASAREAKAKVEPKEEQPKPSPQPPTLNMELSEQPAEVKDEAKERRARVFQKEEPVEYVKPKGFWNWIKGY
ncbi:MAG: hypothetical protein P8P46_02415 [Alphaproteobacteria bacterium]|nr:hypothetical protein [Alphaproteobacteria bacterium]